MTNEKDKVVAIIKVEREGRKEVRLTYVDKLENQKYKFLIVCLFVTRKDAFVGMG